MDLGIVSPVTRTSAGREYQRDLSRQLAATLQRVLATEGGMMALHDAYCVFNRCDVHKARCVQDARLMCVVRCASAADWLRGSCSHVYGLSHSVALHRRAIT
jgi:EAP30/Vps36 family